MGTVKKVAKRIIYSLIPSSYVLMFHHINDGNLIVKSGCILEYKSFLEIIDSGIEFISADEYIKFSLSNRNKCLITFDDGLQDVYRVVYPELTKRGIPLLMFVITDFLDTEGYITTEELLEMAENPLVTIGSHGLSHELFKNLDLNNKRRELLESKEILERLLHKPVKYFAYSHGQYDDSTLDILSETHCYDFAFGVSGYPTNFLTKRWAYHLPRFNCEDRKIPFTIKKSKNETVKLIIK